LNTFPKTNTGFVQNKSTSDAIRNLTEQIYTNLDNKDHTLTIFLDLKKAFDTVNHNILLTKLTNFGIRGTPLSWFQSFLNDRTHRVMIGDNVSNSKTINIGVPQGSILGPLLFLLYINDFPCDDSKFNIILYADDTTLVFKHKNIADLIRNANAQLKLIYSWLLSNRLTLNYGKTYPMIISNRISSNDIVPKIVINRIRFNFSETVKYLGVYIDKELTFRDHIKNIAGKISKTTGIFFINYATIYHFLHLSDFITV